MDEKSLHARQLRLDQAQGFIDAADRLGGGGRSPIVYHLGMLALEKVGKASVLGALGGEKRWTIGRVPSLCDNFEVIAG